MAFSQDAVIVTKPDPVGQEEDAIPTIDILSAGRGKIDDGQFAAATKALREAGLDYSETGEGAGIRVLHFGNEEELDGVIEAMTKIAADSGLKVDSLFTRSDLHEAQDYRGNLQETWNAGGAGQRSSLFGTLVDQFLVPFTQAAGGVGYRFDAGRFADRYGLAPEELSYLQAKLSELVPRGDFGLNRIDGAADQAPAIKSFNRLKLRRATASAETSADSAFGDEPPTILAGVRDVPLFFIQAAGWPV